MPLPLILWSYTTKPPPTSPRLGIERISSYQLHFLYHAHGAAHLFGINESLRIPTKPSGLYSQYCLSFFWNTHTHHDSLYFSYFPLTFNEPSLLSPCFFSRWDICWTPEWTSTKRTLKVPISWGVEKSTKGSFPTENAVAFSVRVCVCVCECVGCPPLPVTVANEGLQGSPTKNVTILVVTVTGQGDNPWQPAPSWENRKSVDLLVGDCILAASCMLIPADLLPTKSLSQKRLNHSCLNTHRIHSHILHVWYIYHYLPTFTIQIN